MLRLIFMSLLVCMTFDETNALSLTLECPQRICLDVVCPNGNVVGANGCPTCDCLPAICSMSNCLLIRCKFTDVITEANGCQTCVCRPPCPVVECPSETSCNYGYLNDSNGCQTCSCKQTLCPTITCPSLNCLYGFQTDANGCQTCKCKCLQMACKCPNGTIWYVDQYGCSRCTCRPRPINQPIEDPLVRRMPDN